MKSIQIAIKLFLIIFLGLNQLNSYAQSFELIIENDTAYCHSIRSSNHANMIIRNVTPDTLDLDIVRSPFEYAPYWYNGICVGPTCYIPLVDSVRTQLLPHSEISFKSGFILNEISTYEIVKAEFNITNIENKDEGVLVETFGLNSILTNTNSINNNQASVKIFPNPALNSISIKSNQEVLELLVYTLDGKIKGKYPYGKTVDLSDYNSGYYFVTIITDLGKTTKPFMVIK